MRLTALNNSATYPELDGNTDAELMRRGGLHQFAAASGCRTCPNDAAVSTLVIAEAIARRLSPPAPWPNPSKASLPVQGEEMLVAEEVAAMVLLHEAGWGAKRLAREFGCARNTVRRYLRAGGAAPFRKPERKTAFDVLDDRLRDRFFLYGGNTADRLALI